MCLFSIASLIVIALLLNMYDYMYFLKIDINFISIASFYLIRYLLFIAKCIIPIEVSLCTLKWNYS